MIQRRVSITSSTDNPQRLQIEQAQKRLVSGLSYSKSGTFTLFEATRKIGLISQALVC